LCGLGLASRHKAVPYLKKSDIITIAYKFIVKDATLGTGLALPSSAVVKAFIL
jgi:hypothetical protein